MSQICEPTCTGLGIRNSNDAFVILEAVRTGIFPLRKQRLSQVERDSLAPGQVFVWTESSESSGLERWTDGRKWSASRTRDVFLIYEEREEPSVDENVEKAQARMNNWVQQPATVNGSGDLFNIFAFPKDRLPKLDGLMKQTFSAWVNDFTTGQRVKWHLSAYLSRQNPNGLPSVESHPALARIQVPDGVYECCTGPRKNRRTSRAQQAPQNPLVASDPYQRRRTHSHHRDASPTPSMTSMRSAVKSESEYWMNSPTSSVPHSPSTCSATPPRTISSSSIGSTAPLPTIFAYADEPLSERPQLSWNPGSRPGGYFYTPPPSSPTEPSSHYSGATPYGPPSASLRAQRDPHRSPSVLPLPIPSSARHHQYPSPSTQEPHPYLPHPTGRHRAGSLNTYTMRSEADSKAVAALAFRPF